jgi:hypothetical protein
MEDLAFKHTIKNANIREQTIGSALARFYDCSIQFNNNPSKLQFWDYTLFNIDNGFLKTCEQCDDFYVKSDDGNLCFEICTFQSDKTTKKGKLWYTSAKRFVYILNNLELVLLLNVQKVRELCVNYESNGILQTTTPTDFNKWFREKDTNPTSCALLPMSEVLLNDDNAQKISFYDLNINNQHYQELR